MLIKNLTPVNYSYITYKTSFCNKQATLRLQSVTSLSYERLETAVLFKQNEQIKSQPNLNKLKS